MISLNKGWLMFSIYIKKIFTLSSQYLLMALLGFSLVACVSAQMPAPTASMANLEKLRTANLAPVKLGEFKLGKDKKAEMDTSVGGLRGSSIKAANGSFSKQLKDEVMVEMKAAGLYDESSKITIESQLTDSQVDAAIKTGFARLAARFQVNRENKNVFDKELSVDSTWESSFIGAIAIPAAINQYTALYKALVGKLFDDAEFRAALAK